MAPEPALSKGSWILVTGVNGFIAAHVAQQFLQRGYRVRGTVRNATKSDWLVKELFAKEASGGTFEMIEIKDMAEENAFQEAVKGMTGIAHIATITSLDSDPAKVIPQTVAGVLNILKAANNEPSIKQFVLTSSVAAATMPLPNTSYHVGVDSWNDMAVQLANAPPPYTSERSMIVYMASKVESEKAMWKFAEDSKPSFTVNAVLPFTVFGDLLHKNQNASTDAWLFQLYHGDLSPVASMATVTSIHVRDTALMHIAAILDPSVENARIHAWSGHSTWQDVVAVFRKLRPEEKFVDDVDLPNQAKMIATVDDALGRRLLKNWAGREGWLDLETGIRDTIDGSWAPSEVSMSRI